MSTKSGNLDDWRDYFRSSNSDIFDIIEHSIMVAASDCPQEFRLRRDRIAEILFSCKLSRCVGCDRVDLAVSRDYDEEGGCKTGSDRDGCEFETGASKESKVNTYGDDHIEINMNHVSNYSYGEAEALTNEIEYESQIVGEVLRIKGILDNSHDEADSVLLDSLRRLQLMGLSVDTMKATEIGKSVNALRKHASNQIRQLARTLIGVWKEMVDEWVKATSTVAVEEGTPESVNPSVIDEEEGLPSPPMDDVGFLSAPIELSQFFDGIDDDGNFRNSGEFNKKYENGRKPSLENQNVPKRKQQVPHESHVTAKDRKGEEMKKQTAVVKPHKPSNTESGSGKPTKVTVERKVNNETKFQKKSDKVTIQKKPLSAQQDKLKCLDEAARLEITKRKLHERYQQAENAKRQRTIQVMELHDLPKQGLGNRHPHMRPGNHNRNWANGRR
ncbi:putative mediator of RNA polymerase II transcription subunit 26b [Camellia lanceoleosa]|uniref:Mediator of RNA polymerase II transcription subunit 26b n=1 Tax=Camellia lanceoleosa TaxID=1840588 RepID=A0ACC0GDE1_9ERIC|nr:putative mediator of RNA polymerase II transcription subunit 26b [Camellia lanceoleosa]